MGMIAKREIRSYPKSVKVWVGKYKHSHNLLHWHSDCELFYVERGSIDVFCEGTNYLLSAGETFFVDRGQMHAMSAREEDTTLLVIFFDDEIVKPALGERRLLCPRLQTSYSVPAVYEKLRDVLRAKAAYCGAEAAAYVLLLMAEIFRGEKSVPRPEDNATRQKFMRLLEEIAAGGAFFTFSDAAAYMGMSAGYFSRYFHGAMGAPFSRYLNDVRVERAVTLLKESGHSMTEIADLSGFGTIRNFNRVFRAVTGYPPRELPADYEFIGGFASPGTASFDPTLHDCELLESAAGA